MKPVRIQLRRTKGFNLQAESIAINGLPAVSVARPGRFGNPYKLDVFGRELSLALFRETVNGLWNPSVMEAHSDEPCNAAYAAHHAFLKRLGGHPLELARSELWGKNLACFCSLAVACHADIWLECAQSVI